MNIFTDVYNKSRGTLQTQSLDSSWSKIETDLKLLLQVDGPDAGKAAVLDAIRKKLATAGKTDLMTSRGMAKEIIKASKSDKRGYQDRAAMLKMLNHFYLVEKKGNQHIWAVDSPKAYGKWTFDQFSGKTEDALEQQLRKRREVFGNGNRKMMSEAHQFARKWSSQVEAALSDKKDKIKKLVKRWFHDGSTGDVDASILILHDGFKKIHAACNSGEVIFSDRPHLRAGGEWDNVYASVNAGDVMPIIYIYQVFLKTGRKNVFGNVPKMWLCALTVIHELTHKLVSTKDIKYDHDGLKPGAGFATAVALTNADSWAYFASDVVGALSRGARNNVLT